MKDLLSTVRNNFQIAENIYEISLALPEDVGKIKGGQFANISTGNGAHLLRRPLGIMRAEGNIISLCYQLRGEGTRELSRVKAGEKLKVLLPLGNGFDLEGKKNIAVIGGGVGIFPLIATIREHYQNKNFHSFIGFRTSSAVCLLDELSLSTTLKVVTDDGSYGEKGNAVQAFLKEDIKYDAIIACGPAVMYRALSAAIKEKDIKIPCYVSLEERMGCGIGACLVCVCGKKNGENVRVCKDGPVFEINDLNL